MDLELELVPLPVSDDTARASHAELVGRGVDVGDVTDAGGGVLPAGLQDRDGGSLVLHQMPRRTGDAC